MIGRSIVKSIWVLLVICIELSDCYVISPEDSNQGLNSISSGPVRDQSPAPPPKISKNQQQIAPSGDNGNASSLEDSTAAQAELELYWLNHRDHFFNLTSFNLTRVSIDFRLTRTAQFRSNLTLLDNYRKQMILWARNMETVAIICPSGSTMKCSKI